MRRHPLGSLLLILAACGGGSSTSIDSSTIDSAPGSPDAPTDGRAPPDADVSCPTPGVLPAMKLAVFASGFTQPVTVVTPPNDPGSLYVVEKGGRIKIRRGGQTLATPFLDISARVNIPNATAEGGLLGLAFAPDYAASGRFYIYFSEKATQTNGERAVVQVYNRSAGNPDVANPTPVADLVDAQQFAYNHLGGSLAFGPDGYLYLSSGDTAAMPSPAPDKHDRHGKILRMDATHPGTAPPNNAPDADPFVWDWGLRNPWRMTFDRATGDMYIGDVGEAQREEIDVEPAGMGHRDYGWDTMEGSVCKVAGCTPIGVPPVVDHPRSEASTIVGGYVYRGAAMPCLRGRYIYTDYATGRFFSFIFDGVGATDKRELTNDLDGGLTGLVAFGEDADGELYAVGLVDGNVYKLVPQ
ncbi:MAG: PQQ-dependent sugar dehydrogenase [Deltaproteobacteria bacterium]|nr:PQQ-dependent sugar dehydrogenase [Deltaproteobacteria bacterium]